MITARSSPLRSGSAAGVAIGRTRRRLGKAIEGTTTDITQGSTTIVADDKRAQDGRVRSTRTSWCLPAPGSDYE
jgi:hypothetical protein